MCNKDEWRTPRWLADWVARRWPVEVDLAATRENRLFGKYLTREQDALSFPWRALGACGFLNPPYSRIDPWIDKAIEEAARGFTTIALIPSPNGESRWSDRIDGRARSVLLICGRIAFCDQAGNPIPGNPYGSALVEFSGCDPSPRTDIRIVRRDDMIAEVSQ